MLHHAERLFAIIAGRPEGADEGWPVEYNVLLRIVVVVMVAALIRRWRVR